MGMIFGRRCRCCCDDDDWYGDLPAEPAKESPPCRHGNPSATCPECPRAELSTSAFEAAMADLYKPQ